jgi:hypothetical protein
LQHPGHCLQHPGHCLQHPGHCLPHSGHCLPHSGHCLPHSGHCLLHSGHHLLHSGHQLRHPRHQLLHLGKLRVTTTNTGSTPPFPSALLLNSLSPYKSHGAPSIRTMSGQIIRHPINSSYPKPSLSDRQRNPHRPALPVSGRRRRPRRPFHSHVPGSF